jgi:hypothetical protein
MMRELTLAEVEYVTGATITGQGIITFIGDSIIEDVKIVNDAFNSDFGSSFGKALDKIGLSFIHYAADSVGYALWKTLAGIGTFLGGDESRITYHMEWEWQ